jgi:hypothetical protein
MGTVSNETEVFINFQNCLHTFIFISNDSTAVCCTTLQITLDHFCHHVHYLIPILDYLLTIRFIRLFYVNLLTFGSRPNFRNLPWKDTALLLF